MLSVGDRGQADRPSLAGSVRERSDSADLVQHLDRLQGSPAILRSRSWCEAERRKETAPEVGEHRRQLCSPGGFRRDHLHTRADIEGVHADLRPASWSVSLIESLVWSVRLYDQKFGEPPCIEDRPALPSAPSTRRMSSLGVAIALFKGNLNINILYMPHAWKDSGYAFGVVVLPALAFLSTLCVWRLLRCRAGNTRSYGDLMELATGRKGRVAVDISIILLQSGCCCLYLINVAALLQDTILPGVPIGVLIVCEAAIVSPLAAVRRVSKLALVNLLAGMLVIVGIVATMSQVGQHMVTFGPRTAEVQAFKPKGMLVSFGTACFVFEGIGLVIPIYDNHRNPEKFPVVYSLVIGLIVLLICAMAFLAYLTFGSDTQTLVLLNLPDGALQKGIKLAFALAMLGTFPLQLLPAINLAGAPFFSPSRPRTRDKHVKSAFRMAYVGFLSMVSIVGATSLDNFVSLIGALCGLPLAYVFPSLCHLYLVAMPRSFDSLVDIAFIVFGMAIALTVTVQNVVAWGG